LGLDAFEEAARVASKLRWGRLKLGEVDLGPDESEEGKGEHQESKEEIKARNELHSGGTGLTEIQQVDNAVGDSQVP